ncbi:hypothetical protein DWW36_02230 [Erysipelotrichaceae bacterium AF15-26LB]|nr:hypothetical protein HMPREF0983_01671 [Erysipelotrichaceae bacterium 3_1_53]RJV92396.1 hypothetical protein DWW36_02230 [Erysipelotrichaceae bacterium AF15-26LB]RJV92645.1 hypothetical protein DWX45_02675 [Erysipelotrichaceae bacterium AF19-24AC]
MGQYYLVANIDKQEYMECTGSLKLMEWSYNRNGVVLTMEDLMAKRWKGDRIYVIGDYAGSEQECAHTEVLRELEKETLQGRTDVSLYDYISDHYKKIKCKNNRSNYRYIFNHQKAMSIWNIVHWIRCWEHSMIMVNGIMQRSLLCRFY